MSLPKPWERSGGLNNHASPNLTGTSLAGSLNGGGLSGGGVGSDWLSGFPSAASSSSTVSGTSSARIPLTASLGNATGASPIGAGAAPPPLPAQRPFGAQGNTAGECCRGPISHRQAIHEGIHYWKRLRAHNGVSRCDWTGRPRALVGLRVLYIGTRQYSASPTKHLLRAAPMESHDICVSVLGIIQLT